MTPLGDTVRFVDRKETYVCVLERLFKSRVVKSLGGDVKQFESTVIDVFGDFSEFRTSRRRINRRGVDSVGNRGVHLVFHQRNKRADDDAHSFGAHGGQLIAERFAPARRHDRKNVFAAKNRANDFFLIGAKRPKTKRVGERLTQSRPRFVDVVAFRFVCVHLCFSPTGKSADASRSARPLRQIFPSRFIISRTAR